MSYISPQYDGLEDEIKSLKQEIAILNELLEREKSKNTQLEKDWEYEHKQRMDWFEECEKLRFSLYLINSNSGISRIPSKKDDLRIIQTLEKSE